MRTIVCLLGTVINMIKKGNQLEILFVKVKGKKGEVIEILRIENRAKVKGINIIKKHEKF